MDPLDGSGEPDAILPPAMRGLADEGLHPGREPEALIALRERPEPPRMHRRVFYIGGPSPRRAI